LFLPSVSLGIAEHDLDQPADGWLEPGNDVRSRMLTNDDK
jgi:hypothetical protein